MESKFRKLAKIEALSLMVILLITMPLKYGFEINGPNKVVGMVHGVLFLVYLVAMVVTGAKLGWKGKQYFFACVASVVPLGPYWLDKKIFKG